MDTDQVKTFFTKNWELVLHLGIVLFAAVRLWYEWTSSWQYIEFGEKVSLSLASLNLLLVFYLNVFWLIPKYLKNRRWWSYIGGLLLLLVGITLLGEWIAYGLHGGGNEPVHLIMVIFGLIFSFGYTFTRDWILNQTEIERLKAEKLSMELAFLKSQVDPHFLFNTLNTLYASALEENGMKTADGIAKLGTLMRYNLHDSQAEFISLQKEVDYIEKYIALQQLRLTDKNQVIYKNLLHEEGIGAAEIAPMLLIPFVENAFKFGVSPTEETRIMVELRLAGDMLFLKVVNTIIAKAQELVGTGVGLQNVKHRLQLLYPDRHQLEVGRQENIFTVDLTINLAK